MKQFRFIQWCLKYSTYWVSQIEPPGSGQANGQISPNFRPRLAEGPNIQLQNTFFDYIASVRISERAKLSDFDRIEIQNNDLFWWFWVLWKTVATTNISDQ